MTASRPRAYYHVLFGIWILLITGLVFLLDLMLPMISESSDPCATFAEHRDMRLAAAVQDVVMNGSTRNRLILRQDGKTMQVDDIHPALKGRIQIGDSIRKLPGSLMAEVRFQQGGWQSVQLFSDAPECTLPTPPPHR